MTLMNKLRELNAIDYNTLITVKTINSDDYELPRQQWVDVAIDELHYNRPDLMDSIVQDYDKETLSLDGFNHYVIYVNQELFHLASERLARWQYERQNGY